MSTLLDNADARVEGPIPRGWSGQLNFDFLPIVRSGEEGPPACDGTMHVIVRSGVDFQSGPILRLRRMVGEIFQSPRDPTTISEDREARQKVRRFTDKGLSVGSGGDS